MTDFNKTFEKFKGIEFSNPSDILHRNKGEGGLTYYGIYQVAHPSLPIWAIIEANISDCQGSLRKASSYLSTIESLQNDVKEFYYDNYFLPLGLDNIVHQKVRDELFYFAINQGSLSRAIKYAQCVVGKLVCDGIMGDKTLLKLNSLTLEELALFDVEYDKKEIAYYFSLKKPKNLDWWLRYIKGWVYRAIKI